MGLGMKIDAESEARTLFLVIAFLAGLGWNPASAQQRAYLIDLNDRTAIQLGGNYTIASAINDAGQVVGTTYTSESWLYAYVTGPDGAGMRDLGTLGLGGESSPSDINEVGQVAGLSYAGEGHWHAFITGPDGKDITDLGALGLDSSASGIIMPGEWWAGLIRPKPGIRLHHRS